MTDVIHCSACGCIIWDASTEADPHADKPLCQECHEALEANEEDQAESSVGKKPPPSGHVSCAVPPG